MAPLDPGASGALAKSSVVRLLRAHGLSARPRATPLRERRAFTVGLPGDVWMGDAMHGPPVFDQDGVLRKKAYLVTQIDVASRFIINSGVFLHEAAEHQEDGLRRAITGHGIPREYYVDLGAAYVAHSLRTTRMRPPHFRQRAMSMAKTRARSFAQAMRRT